MHSHPEFSKIILTNVKYVWQDENAKEVGLAIEPFYPNQVKAIKADSNLYLVLALIEMVRVGKIREINFAKTKLRKLFKIGS